MIQGRIDRLADEYMMLINSEKRLKLSSIKRAERIVSAFCFLLLCFAGSMVIASHTAHMEVEFEIVFFSLVLFVEVAVGRTAKNAIPFWVLLVTSIVGTVLSHLMICYFIPYSIVFILFETKLVAMKNLPGYPLFEDIDTESLKKDMTAEQLMAYNKKLYSDMADKEAARERDSKKLDKILSGEMDLDEFLGVEKRDTKNVRMDDYMEYHEPEPSQPEKDDIDDDSAEAFFRRFEKQGGGLKEKEKEAQSWLEGGDANSAENYFGKFTQSGGKLDDETSFKTKITFDRVKGTVNGGKDD